MIGLQSCGPIVLSAAASCGRAEESCKENKMDTRFTDEQLALRDRIAKFAQEVLAPEAERIDREGFDMDHYRKVMDAGLVAVPLPKEVGGEGMGTVGRCILLEEVSKVCPSTALSYLVGGMSLYYPGASQELIDKYYMPWVQGKILPAFVFTEPNAGSDAAAISTVAAEDGDEFVLNGKKHLICNGASADVLNVFAITDPEEKVSRRLSVFCVPKGTPGVKATVQPGMSLAGAELAEIEFTDCRIPAGNMIGERGKGFGMAMSGIAGGRINAAACAVGIAAHAVEDAVAYVKEREQFGKPIAANQAVAFTIAKMRRRMESAKALLYKAADMIDRKDPEAALYTSMAKAEATDASVYCADENLQLHGGIGCLKGCEAERIFRDAHAARIYDGTTNVLDMVISRDMLK